MQGADYAPTTQAAAAVMDAEKTWLALKTRWQEIVSKDLTALNAQLKAGGLPEVALTQ